ncbi:unnamed protein product [Dibothriocephalus latus]|uniref:Pyrroline-5-carboxylate reductase 3 n=1 Tax=Dibothriocephalus latus TaxID=60516 RepID=A0A3P6TA90_DIBLA|nr:unnamed protein product [Dibothriocephalus latus]
MACNNQGDADMTAKKAIVGDRRFGFLGSGQMSQAIARGLLSGGLLQGTHVTMSDIFGTGPEDARFYAPIKKMKEAYGIEYVQDNIPMVKKSDVIFLCVKPNLAQTVLRACGDTLANKLVISIAAGVTVGDLEAAVPSATRVIRVMPNTPCLVQQGAAAFSRGSKATEDDVKVLKAVFSVIFPVCEEVPESLQNTVAALSGSGPAYILMVIEAMADGGVRLGLTRALAQKLAIQTVLGTAVMARESEFHPAKLRDDVCSPGGSTIAGTHVLESAAVRASFSACIEAAKKRNDELGQVSK